MERKFRVGQLVRVVKARQPENKSRVGILAKIVAIWPTFEYELDIPRNDGLFPSWYAMEDQLEPVYDGDEKSSWSECVWKPKSDARQPSNLVPTNE